MKKLVFFRACLMILVFIGGVLLFNRFYEGYAKDVVSNYCNYFFDTFYDKDNMPSVEDIEAFYYEGRTNIKGEHTNNIFAPTIGVFHDGYDTMYFDGERIRGAEGSNTIFKHEAILNGKTSRYFKDLSNMPNEFDRRRIGVRSISYTYINHDIVPKNGDIVYVGSLEGYYSIVMPMIAFSVLFGALLVAIFIVWNMYSKKHMASQS